MSDNRNYLPDHYTEVSEPFFEGRGNHSVMKLEEICEQYKEFTHQLQIKFQNASQQTASLREENEKLQTDLMNANSEIDQWKDSLPHKALVRRNRELQEEVERLKNQINEKTIEVMFAESWYELADISYEFGVTWMHIYDEPPSRHVDRVKWASITNIRIKALSSKESKSS